MPYVRFFLRTTRWLVPLHFGQRIPSVDSFGVQVGRRGDICQFIVLLPGKSTGGLAGCECSVF